jgi:hypothetical protein
MEAHALGEISSRHSFAYQYRQNQGKFRIAYFKLIFLQKIFPWFYPINAFSTVHSTNLPYSEVMQRYYVSLKKARFNKLLLLLFGAVVTISLSCKSSFFHFFLK